MIKRIKAIDVRNTSVLVRTETEVKLNDSATCRIGLVERGHEPLGLLSVVAAVRQAGYEIETLMPSTSAISMEEILRNDPDVFLLSFITFNANFSLKIAKEVKERRPEALVIVGGYHASGLPEEVSMHPGVDFLIKGEGEFAVVDLLAYLGGNISKAVARGVVYQQGRLLINNPVRVDADSIPIIYRSKELMGSAKRGGLYCPSPNKQVAPILITTLRGCPFSCSYCATGVVFPTCPKSHQRVIRRYLKDVIEEIDYSIKKFGTNFIFIVDPTFEDRPFLETVKLCEELGKRGVLWYAMCRVGVTSKVLAVMKAGGCVQIGLGIEKYQPNKSGFGDSEDKWQYEIDDTINRIQNDFGMVCKAYFMLNGTTRLELEEQGEAILSCPALDFRIAFATPFPGTQFYEEVKENLTASFSDFTTDIPVLPSEVGREEQISFRNDLFKKIYERRSSYWTRAKNFVEGNSEWKESLEEWKSYLQRKGYY